MHGSLRERLQSLVALFVPFISSTLRRASELATALDARGYEVKGRQTMLHDTTWSAADYLVMGVVAVVTIGVLVI
jgi:energy-coupling factor transport system permease protein